MVGVQGSELEFEREVWLRNIDLGIVGVKIMCVERLSNGSVKNKVQWEPRVDLRGDVPMSQ